ncbi:MAG: hypothetical protein J6D34_06200 [Atopobiaceae bacterium]|nr:hypothetical protein [Atopobiaceae bacterium]
MIRTNSVKLTVIPALAYRQKLSAGDASLVVLRADSTQPGTALISKTSGDPIVSANTPADLFPVEAFAEAMTLTAGLPYHKQGKPKLVAQDLTDEPEVDLIEDAPEEDEAPQQVVNVIDSDEYLAIVKAYTDKNGKFSYDHINKEMIQFAHSSEMVGRMLAAGDSEETIRMFIVGTKFRNISGNKDLTDEEVLAIAALLDEVSPKGVFKDLNKELRTMMGAAKRM